MGNVLFSGFRFTHHNTGSGYDGVVNDRKHYVCGNMLPFGACRATSFWRRINFLLTDFVTLFRGMGYSNIHYIYPENTAYLSPMILKILGKKIIYTIHLEEKFWVSSARNPLGWMKRRCFRLADPVITLSSDQALRIQQMFPRKQVFFVPHGLDMETTLPDNETFKNRLAQLKVVVVGNNYRNFDMLEKIVNTRSSRMVTFHLVGLDESNRNRFAGVPDVTCYDRLDSERYEDLLLSSFIMALPLTFATANNALLEAHKNYLPSVCSDVPGVRDYATTDTLFFDTLEEFWTAFDRLASLDFQAYRDICIRAHNEGRARFSWENVRQQITNKFTTG